LCALFQKNGDVDYTVSEDTDTLAYGCEKTLKILKNSNSFFVETDMSVVLEKLGISFEQFLDMCVLSGCDYLEKVPYLKIENCFQLIKKHGNLEKAIQQIKKSTKIHSIEDYSRVRDIYCLRNIESSTLIVQREEERHVIKKCLNNFIAETPLKTRAMQYDNDQSKKDVHDTDERDVFNKKIIDFYRNNGLCNISCTKFADMMTESMKRFVEVRKNVT
jgi:5'-3' exonuclease